MPEAIRLTRERGPSPVAARKRERSYTCEPGPLAAHIYEHEDLSQSSS